VAADYEVNIKLNTDQITKDLNTVGGKIKNLGKTQNTKAKKALSNSDAVLKKEIAILATENRALRTKGQLLKLEKDGFGVKNQLRKLDDAINIARKGEVDFAKTVIQKQERAVILRRNQLTTETKITEQKSKQAALSTGIGSPVFGKPGQIGSPTNISAILNDPLTSVSPVQQALKKMDDKTKLDQKQAEINRKKSLSIGKDIVKIKVDEGKAIAKNLDLEGKQVAKQSQRLNAAISPKGDFSRLSDRQSRNAQGGRTFMNNSFARAGIPMPTRGFDMQSALISGAFPLLFGQGPVGAIAGGLGGGVGGMFGGMGGFAGGIAATAIVQQIQSAISGISELGKALGPFAKNTDAVTTALGLQGSAEEARIQMIEKTQGKTAAFNAAMQVMNVQIGDKGVDALSEFGETTRLMNNQFAIAITRIGAFTAGLLNFVNKTLGIQQGLQRGSANRALKLGIAEKDPRALALQARQAEIDAMPKVERIVDVPGIDGTQQQIMALPSKQAEEAQAALDLDKQRFNVIRNTEAEAALLTEKFDALLKANEKEEELTERVLELRRSGLNPEVAKTVAEIEKQATLSKESLDNEINQLQNNKERSVDEQTRLDTLKDQKKAIDDGVKGLDKKLQKTHELTEAATQTLDAFERLRDTITIDIGNGIKGLIKGTESLNDVLRNVVDKLADAALNMAIFGNVGGGSVTGGILGSIFKAEGGPVKRGGSFIVGERGPELFTPGVSGMITPNHALGGSTNVVVNVDASGSSVEGDEEQGRELGRMISVAIQSELVKQKRPGGLLT
jgi:hypothetical protein